jgi:hypothetical protein
MFMAVMKVNKKNIYMGFDGLHLFHIWFQWFQILHRFMVGLQQHMTQRLLFTRWCNEWQRKDKTAHRHTQTHNERQ